MKDTILVTGSRELTDANLIVQALVDALRVMDRLPGDPSPYTRLVHGDARGADRTAGAVAQSMGLVVVRYPVNTSVDGPWPAAGVRRNQRMLDAERDRVGIVLAFTNLSHGILTRGTADMVRRACRADLRVEAWWRTDDGDAAWAVHR